jgi:hypothetical protein
VSRDHFDPLSVKFSRKNLVPERREVKGEGEDGWERGSRGGRTRKEEEARDVSIPFSPYSLFQNFRNKVIFFLKIREAVCFPIDGL